MNNFEQYLIDLLQGAILYEGSPVEVVKSFSNAPKLPVITLDLSGGVTTKNIYHDVEDTTEKLYFHRVSNININVWCNTEEERESVCNSILSCFYKEKTNHYCYCSNFNNGSCSTGGNCKALSILNNRSVKNKCPDPELYRYESLSQKHGIYEGQVLIEPPFDMDEVERNPPLLRSILRGRAEYLELVSEQGVTIDQFNIGDVNVR